jgi:hypothetical protein
VVFVNLLSLAIIPTAPSTNPFESMARQALGGTAFGQTATAAAWAALGPSPFMWRLPLSLAWIALVSVASGINGSLYDRSSEDFVIAGMVLFCQWLLLQIPLWAVVIGFGVQLRHIDEAENQLPASQRQFGIRQLMLVTVIVAVLSGIGRIAVPPLLVQEEFLKAVGPILAFLVVAEVAITFPLVFAALLRRHAFVGVMITLGLIAVGTACEIPLIQMTTAGGGPTVWEVIALNTGTVAWMILFLSIVRFNGYALARAQPLFIA